ncbi:MAG: bifunctional riboflavin kinase/FAD synthetase, partial [Burkholderiales bacterium]|nr:bifunctional riboflavin kinase/FAD synthetase [Burkholderiales bacterium]
RLKNPVGKKGRALTIGNFDGVHLGHQAMLRRLVTVADERNLISTVIIFEPHPAEFFSPLEAPTRLYGYREKVMSFSDAGIEQVVVLPFNKKYSLMLAEDFVNDVLVSTLCVKWLLIGDDFRFGFRRGGDYDTLLEKSLECEFELEATQSVTVAGERVSSTAVRNALASGDLKFAEEMMGKRYNVSGRVVQGDQIGRTLGYPTANIHFGRASFPLSGVFTAYIDGPEFNQRPALLSVGKRPTVTKSGHVCIEVYLIDYTGDLYGQRLYVEVISKLRDQETFDNTDTLIEAMKEDERQARQFFNIK